MMPKNSIGGISLGEIESFASNTEKLPIEAGSSELARFSQSVARLINLRIGKGEKYGIVAFLLSDLISSDSRKTACLEYPLLQNGNEAIVGHIWLTTANVGVAYQLSAPWSNATELFSAVRLAGFGKLAAIVIDYRSPTPDVLLYDQGLDEPHRNAAIQLDDTPISEARMKEALNGFYTNSIRTPSLIAESGGGRIWQDARKGIPEEGPEKKIQGRLTESLRGRFPTHSVRPERSTGEGRADLVIYRNTKDGQGLPTIRNEWLLELKALCEKTHTESAIPPSNTKKAIKDGLDQILAYKKDFHPVASALCCYDMRKEDETDAKCFSSIKATADAESVHLWRWHLLRSASAARRAEAAV